MTKKTPGKKLFEDLGISPIKNSESMDTSADWDVSFLSSHTNTQASEYILSSPNKKIQPSTGTYYTPIPTKNKPSYVDRIDESSFLMRYTDTTQNIQEQLNNGEDPNYQNRRGDSALHILSRELNANNIYNCIERISLLIENGAKISMPNKQERTPLDTILSKLKRYEIKLDKKESGIFYQNILGAILNKETLNQYKDNYIKLLNDLMNLTAEELLKEQQDEIYNFISHNLSLMNQRNEGISIVSLAAEKKLDSLSSSLKNLSLKIALAGSKTIVSQKTASNKNSNIWSGDIMTNILEFAGYSGQLFAGNSLNNKADSANLRVTSETPNQPLWYNDQQITNLLNRYLGENGEDALYHVDLSTVFRTKIHAIF